MQTHPHTPTPPPHTHTQTHPSTDQTSYILFHFTLIIHRLGIVLHYSGHGHSHGGLSHGHSNGDSYEPLSIQADEQTSLAVAHSHKHKKNVNVRAAFIHVIGDLIQSAGVFLAAVIIKFKVHI